MSVRPSSEGTTPRGAYRLGRYAIHSEIAAGGMATVYLGRLMGAVGFTRVVAVKRMHPHFARDPEFVAMFLDEGHLAARIHHPNVVSTLDVVAQEGEIFLVMEYIRGEPLSALLRTARRQHQAIPMPIVFALMAGILSGLHAVHESTGEGGEHLGLIHRDVSPQNVMVGQDGLARLLDFGVAKAATRLQVTQANQLKGKLNYMAPEQLDGKKNPIDRGVDIFAAGAVLFELLIGKRLFTADDPGSLIARILLGELPAVVPLRPEVSPELEAVVHRALARDRADRFETAEAFSAALEACAPKVASARAVGEWVRALAPESLARRDAHIKEIESQSSQALEALPLLAGDSMRPPNWGPPPTAPRVSGPPTSIDAEEAEPEQISVPTAATAVATTRSTVPVEPVKRRWGLWVGGAVAVTAITGLAVWRATSSEVEIDRRATETAVVGAAALPSPPPREEPTAEPRPAAAPTAEPLAEDDLAPAEAASAAASAKPPAGAKPTQSSPKGGGKPAGDPPPTSTTYLPDRP